MFQILLRAFIFECPWAFVIKCTWALVFECICVFTSNCSFRRSIIWVVVYDSILGRAFLFECLGNAPKLSISTCEIAHGHLRSKFRVLLKPSLSFLIFIKYIWTRKANIHIFLQIVSPPAEWKIYWHGKKTTNYQLWTPLHA